jgi:OPT oligopeptide transporter protein
MFTIPAIIGALLSIFSTAVMSYIAMATPIGPWIAPTLVLIGALLFKIAFQTIKTAPLAYAVCAGSIGGILATALGFSFPTLYFLEPALFNAWMGSPLYFMVIVGALSGVAGWLGIWIANVSEHKLLVTEQLAFPIGQLVYKMITAITQHMRKAYELMFGFVSTAFFCVLQDGIGVVKSYIPQSIALLPAACVGFISVPAIRFDLMPFVWAVGFLTGHVIALPLLVGAVSRIVILDPLHRLPVFAHLSSVEFVLAFCSGLVLIGTLTSFMNLPRSLYTGFKKAFERSSTQSLLSDTGMTMSLVIEFICLLCAYIAFFSYFKFSIVSQCFILITTMLCAYQMAAIAGKIGMALLGRFATFVMIPGIILFGFDSMQAVLVATFVEVCGGVATDTLFGRKMAQSASISTQRMAYFQYFGLCVSCITVGIVFWALINHFHLGSVHLFAQKAQARQLLIQAQQFDTYVLMLGALFGLILGYIKINPALVFGGLLMPVNLVVGLVVGALCTWFVKEKEDYFPFWSGVFASQSIWMLLRALITF